MDFGANKTPAEVIRKVLEEHILETFILVLMVNGTKSHGKIWSVENYWLEVLLLRLLWL